MIPEQIVYVLGDILQQQVINQQKDLAHLKNTHGRFCVIVRVVGTRQISSPAVQCPVLLSVPIPREAINLIITNWHYNPREG